MKKVLVCDDDQGILEVIKIVLEEKGYRVITIADCFEIYKKIEKAQPDIILLDLWMPDIGGEEIVRHLKADAKMKNVPIVVISAAKESEKIAGKIGANSFLGKPFDIEDLERIIAGHFT